MTSTDLDRAHAAMTAAPEDDALRLRFFERLADNELFMLLGAEPDGDHITPALFEVEDVQYALVFDREDRLADFVGREAPYAGLSGRGLCQMLAGQGVGLGLNLEVAPSSMLVPPQAIDWLVETLAHTPEMEAARLTAVTPPKGVPEDVIAGLDRKLAMTAGLASAAYLSGVTYEDGGTGHILVFVGADPAAEQGLANAAAEALRFSGIEAGTMDVLFAEEGDPLVKRVAKVGIRFDLPLPEAPRPIVPPGSDPNSPPKLR